MRILILGGTAFLGRHLVDAALTKGHEVTLFNRGQTHPDLYPEVETLHGDRDGRLEALCGRSFDAVLDTSGYVPRVVRQSVALLRDAVMHYTFVSSISVYADFTQVEMDEDARLGTLEDETIENIAEHYGALKALCEQEVRSTFGERALIIRPGLIVGPHDPTDRFTYWVRRFGQSGNVLVPGRRDARVQFIDGRDLADWMIRMVENKTSGVFNATGPTNARTMGELIDNLQEEIPSSGQATWVSEAFLESQGVAEWTDLPLWLSDQTGWPGFMSVDVGRAVAQGLTYRPVRETIRDTRRWDQTRPLDSDLKAGLSHERERDLLRAWKVWNAK
ncbi:MAG: NAD-dependent epimerase/dehydratase family protein [Alicyclobacillaceae bacterium]|nr:NAD-dependent epimerase/dehydratase family protein [Alicyclobacillaceae bacterium]